MIYPGDRKGGAWIGANEYAIALAVLNWNDVVPRSATIKKKQSRDGLIPALIASVRWRTAGGTVRLELAGNAALSVGWHISFEKTDR